MSELAHLSASIESLRNLLTLWFDPGDFRGQDYLKQAISATWERVEGFARQQSIDADPMRSFLETWSADHREALRELVGQLAEAREAHNTEAEHARWVRSLEADKRFVHLLQNDPKNVSGLLRWSEECIAWLEAQFESNPVLLSVEDHFDWYKLACNTFVRVCRFCPPDLADQIGQPEPHPPYPSGARVLKNLRRLAEWCRGSVARGDAGTPQESIAGVNYLPMMPPFLGTATALWEQDPIRAFEELRDHVRQGLAMVCEIHGAATAAPPKQALVDTRPELHGPLLRALVAAQEIWFDTPVRRYLDRPEPVYLDPVGGPGNAGLCGSSFHDMAMAAASFLIRCIDEGRLATDYVQWMRYHTAAGDQVIQRLSSFGPQVSSECRQGIGRWQTETTAMGGVSGSPRPAEEQRPGILGNVPEGTVCERCGHAGYPLYQIADGRLWCEECMQAFGICGPNVLADWARTFGIPLAVFEEHPPPPGSTATDWAKIASKAGYQFLGCNPNGEQPSPVVAEDPAGLLAHCRWLREWLDGGGNGPVVRAFGPGMVRELWRAIRLMKHRRLPDFREPEIIADVAAAQRALDDVVRWCEVQLAEATPRAGKPKRRRQATARKPTPLTEAQIEAVHFVGEHKGNIAAAGRAAGKSRQAMKKLYDKGMKKLGRIALNPKTQRMPLDPRGQETIPARED